MKRLASLVAAAAVSSAIVLSARDASALGAEVGADIGYGLKPFGDSAAQTANRFGLGVGGHAGFEVFNIYFGASIRYYFSDGSNLVTAPVGSPSYHNLTQTLQVGGEIGYQINVLILTLRPYVWAGPTMYMETADNPAVSLQNSTRFSLAPGLLARLKVVSPFYIGADVRYSIILGGEGEDPNTQLSFMGSLGLAF